MNISRALIAALLIGFSTAAIIGQNKAPGSITEFPVNYPNLSQGHGTHGGMGSTHEITFN